MAAVTTAAIGTAVSGYTIAQGIKQKKEGQRLLSNYDRQDISDQSSPYANMQLSTVGSDLMREENQSATANAFDVLSMAGDRSIVGGVGKVVATNNTANKQAQQYLDEQDIKRKYALAGDQVHLREMRENRDNQNIAAINSQIQSGSQAINDGIMGFASSAASMGRALQLNKANKKVEEMLKDGGKSTSPTTLWRTTSPNIYPQTENHYNPFYFFDYPNG